MFDRMLEGIQIVDAEYRYLYLNETAAAHGHRRREELLGRTMPEMYPGIEHTGVFSSITSCLRDRVPQQLVNEFTYPDGRKGWFDLRMAPVPAGALIMSVDVTEQKQAEAELRRAVAALEETGRRRTEMIAMLAHELRNPLAPLRHGIHILRSRLERSDAGAQRALEAMERQVRHLTVFVDGLLDVNRMRSGKITLHPERVDLARLVRNLVEEQAPHFAEEGLELRAETPPGPVWVDADEPRLAQALGNLLDNAGKFTPEGGRAVVRVEAAPDAGSVVVEIRDTGIGIAPEDLEHVFEPLFQADRSLERIRGGLGLGLSIARGLIELHGGSISCESGGPGRGTVVRVELPLAAAALDAAQEPGASGTPGRKRVLLIEDNRDAAETLGAILDLWGYQVGLAFTGQEGLDQARRTRPEIVLCDIGLPGLDGYAVARALRAEDSLRDTRLIAITGYAHEHDRSRAREAGFDLHLTKPVNPDSLRVELER